LEIAAELPRARTRLPAVKVWTVKPRGVSDSVPTPAQKRVVSERYATPNATANRDLNLASTRSDKNRECSGCRRSFGGYGSSINMRRIALGGEEYDAVERR